MPFDTNKPKPPAVSLKVGDEQVLWAMDPPAPGTSVPLELSVGGKVVYSDSFTID